jgi:YVTN family beta-propeller protein
MAVSPDGRRVYAVNSAGDSVSVIDAATNRVIATIGTGSSPFGIALSPDGSRAVTNHGGHSVSVIDTAANTMVRWYRSGPSRWVCRSRRTAPGCTWRTRSAGRSP